VNLYRPCIALAVASDSGYGCWVTFTDDDGSTVTYPDVRPDDAPAGSEGRELDPLTVLRRLLAGWP
jgi:hypothetical protein